MVALREYIEERCIPVPFAGCWMWLFSFGSHGYGNGHYPGGRSTVAHRMSYEAFKGLIPDGMLVQHSCDNKWCVNPDHLSLGTDKTNSDDKHRKGRANLESRVFHPRKDRHFTNGQVAAIRASSESHKGIARRCGVSPRAIWAIRQGHTYKDAYGADHSLLPFLPEEIEALDRMFEQEAANDDEPPGTCSSRTTT